MKLSYRCQSCKKDNFIKSKSSTRVELKMELNSDVIKEKCSHCGFTNTKHINRLYAEQNYYIILLGVLLAVILTILLWDFGFVSTLTGTIPIYFWVSEQKRASAFNSTMVRRK